MSADPPSSESATTEGSTTEGSATASSATESRATGSANPSPRTAAADGRPGARRRPGRARRLAGCLVFLLLLALLAVWGRPYLRHAGRVFDLVRAEAPSSLPVPVEGVAPGRLADTWGAARSGGRRHEGIDIFAPRGTAVLSTTRGIVVRRGENRLGGRIVTVMGPGRQFHYYAHLDDWSEVAVGDWVEAGAVLGEVGSSGNAAGTPPHLHYGIYANGAGAVNPYPLLTTP